MFCMFVVCARLEVFLPPSGVEPYVFVWFLVHAIGIEIIPWIVFGLSCSRYSDKKSLFLSVHQLILSSMFVYIIQFSCSA